MTRGAIASGDERSAAVGRDLLLAGGNAVDAFVGAALMAAFTMPTLTGLGGAGVLTVRSGDEVHVLDFFADVPGRGRGDEPRPPMEEVLVHFEDATQTFHVGPGSVAVPGAAHGLVEAHRRWGRLPLGEVVRPAVEAARRGVEVTPALYRGFAILEDILRRDPACWALIGDEAGILQPGSRMRNPDLADTLEQLAAEGVRPFRDGDVARAIVTATDGCVTLEDLRAYQPALRRPLRGHYRGRTIFTPGPPSLGGALLLASLAHLECGPRIPRRMRTGDWGRVVDALRHGDRMRTPDYEERLFEDGWLEGFVARSPSGSTLQISCIDESGTVVSCTTTVGETAGVVAPGTGVVLNNFLGELDIHPGHLVRPAGHRMMTGTAPSLLSSPDGRWLALGSAGSARIRAALLQVIVHAVDRRDDLRAAVGRPRIHVDGDVLYVEGYGRTHDEVEALRPLAPSLVATWAPSFFFGGVQAVGLREDGCFDAGAEEVRRGGAAYVVETTDPSAPERSADRIST